MKLELIMTGIACVVNFLGFVVGLNLPTREPLKTVLLVLFGIGFVATVGATLFGWN